MEIFKLPILVSGLLLASWSFGSNSWIGPDTTIFFDSGRSDLTMAGKNQLKSLVKKAQKKGKIDQIQVATWSDNSIPLGENKLSEADRELADRRSESVRFYLENYLKVKDITIHNMAERSTWLSRTFETDDAELKSDLAKGPDAPMSKEEFKVFREHGEPSTSVVLTILKD